MLQLCGIVVLFACVFGGYIMSGGSLGVVFEALPHEILTIFGAALAALLVGGSMFEMKKIAGEMGKIVSGSNGSKAITPICCAFCSCSPR